jgi:hypothetical protein
LEKILSSVYPSVVIIFIRLEVEAEVAGQNVNLQALFAATLSAPRNPSRVLHQDPV